MNYEQTFVDLLPTSRESQLNSQIENNGFTIPQI